ncbi:acyl-CoA/acyl-ACP dehydrogenase [Candidatus Binatia bacterium]|jgi:alkylation response protein AidB-like acyl-CoA dehydrogenase|nr:acyl-CoA/acyl-ACP dehydrogenase [Candidatus Binatia bacterium]
MALTKDLGFGPDEQLVRDQARKLLKDSVPVDKLRTLVARDHHEAYETKIQPASWDEGLWKQMIELGWTALSVPESAGGLGMKTIVSVALAEELGRVAVPSPLPATLAATVVLKAAGATSWLEKIAGGEAATLAVTPESGSWEPGDTDVEARAAGGGVTLHGKASFVQDARKARLLVVSAKSPAGVALYVVPVDAPGVTITPDRIVDLTRDQATVSFDGVAVDAKNVAAGEGKGKAVLEQALPAILTLLAADACGAAEWQLQTTAEYAKSRVQFEHPIGFFQAVKHPLVNVMLAIDRAKSLTYAAACAVDEDPADALRLARMAKAAASDAAAFASDRSVQLHGGIGFTWECDVHLWFKRQKHTEQLFGNATQQRAHLARILEAAL